MFLPDLSFSQASLKSPPAPPPASKVQIDTAHAAAAHVDRKTREHREAWPGAFERPLVAGIGKHRAHGMRGREVGRCLACIRPRVSYSSALARSLELSGPFARNIPRARQVRDTQRAAVAGQAWDSMCS